MASIIMTSGAQKGEFLPLGRRTNVIGRAETIPLQVLDDLVSRKHLRISFDESADTYYAEDLNSKHGVFINNRRITDETALAEGDEILIGHTRCCSPRKTSMIAKVLLPTTSKSVSDSVLRKMSNDSRPSHNLFPLIREQP